MSWLVERFAEYGKKTAIEDSSGSYSYSKLFEQIEKYKSELDDEFDDFQVVAVLSDYDFWAVSLFLALYLKRCIIVPIVSINHEEIVRRLDVVNPDFIIRLDGSELCYERRPKEVSRHEMILDLNRRGQPGLVLFSSGSTGKPKAMIHNLEALLDVCSGRKEKKITFLVFLMFDHIGGLNTLLNTLAMGAKIVFPSVRTPDHVASLIEEHEVHVLPASPTFLNMMLMAEVHKRFDLRSIKMITYGTEPMPQSLLSRLRQTFPRAKLLQTFGTSETGISQTSSRCSDSLDIKFDCPNVSYKVVDGELWLKSKTQVMGYLNAPMDSFTNDGWFRTGDLVEEGEDGFIKIVGRVKEVINVGGEKVLPSEVESAVFELGFVKDCVVYGERNAIVGQVVALEAVLEAGFDPGQAKALIRSHCRKRLENYKVPAKLMFVDAVKFGERFKKRRV